MYLAVVENRSLGINYTALYENKLSIQFVDPTVYSFDAFIWLQFSDTAVSIMFLNDSTDWQYT
jgi:hypothetical protein